MKNCVYESVNKIILIFFQRFNLGYASAGSGAGSSSDGSSHTFTQTNNDGHGSFSSSSEPPGPGNNFNHQFESNFPNNNGFPNGFNPAFVPPAFNQQFPNYGPTFPYNTQPNPFFNQQPPLVNPFQSGFNGNPHQQPFPAPFPFQPLATPQQFSEYLKSIQDQYVV